MLNLRGAQWYVNNKRNLRCPVAKDLNWSLLYSIGPPLGPNRPQPHTPVGCETFKRGVAASFSSGFTFFWTKAENPEGTPSWPWRHWE